MSTTPLTSNVWQVQDLVRRATERDSAAFTALYERYQPRVERYLATRLPGQTDEAEDLTADVFAKVFERLDTYQFRGLPFSAWLFRIAHNQLVDYVRRRPKQQVEALEEAAEVQEPAALREFEHHLVADLIKTALPLLTAEQREVVVMRFEQGLSISETAERSGRSEEAVKKLQARGLASLKRTMDCRSGCWRIAEPA